MDRQIITIYCVIDDILKAINHKEERNEKISDSEVITTVVVSSLKYYGNVESAREFLLTEGYIPKMLSKSRLNRRIHKIKNLIYNLFHQLGFVFKKLNIKSQYIIDSFPVSICDNIRISRCRIVDSEEFRGKIASKRKYFYGVKLFVMTTGDGIPVEAAFLPGSNHDVKGLQVLPFELPSGSEVIADSAFTDYNIEDASVEENIKLNPQRKKNSKRGDPFLEIIYKKNLRRKIETVFSVIKAKFPNHIHAVTLDGFLFKTFSFVFSYMLSTVFF